jgi:hypothetical protein
MTLQFVGTLRYRFRLSIFGYDIFAGPWNTQNVSFSEAIPSESATVPLVDGFTASVSESGNGIELALLWEGIPITSDTVPLSGSLPISVQPLKGVILAGTAKVG